MSSILEALATSNMFRDMSGLAATIGLTGGALGSTSEQAQQAAAQAGQNMKTAGDFLATLAAMVVSAVTGVPVAGPAQQNISNSGAALNQAKKTAPPQGATGSGGAGSGSPSGSGGGQAGGGASGASGNGATPTRDPTTSLEIDALRSSGVADHMSGGGGGAGSPLGAVLQAILAASGAAGAGSATAAKPTLTPGQKVPNISESTAVGAIAAKIVRGTPEFNGLVVNSNPAIVFKDEEGSGADRHMTQRLSDRLDDLATRVSSEWPGHRLRVTEAWDETNEHAPTSTHYEGRGADLTVSDLDQAKLGRLAQLAVDAGFGWVFYENTAHVHVSVST
jgi:hypothetical protein